MAGRTDPTKARQAIKRLTAHIRPDPRPGLDLERREHLEQLYTRLIPAVYDYPDLPIEEIVQAAALKLAAAEARHLAVRLAAVRRRRHLAVVSRGEEDVLLPLRPDFDPRDHPLAAVWADGGFWTPGQRDQANRPRLRRLGLPDGLDGYASYRILILQPDTGRPNLQSGPDPVAVASSYEAEVAAVELALNALIAYLETARHLPPVDRFQVVLFSDCQSLVQIINRPPGPAEIPAIERIRESAALFRAVNFSWESRRRIKKRLGH